jgi:hypothetical protein
MLILHQTATMAEPAVGASVRALYDSERRYYAGGEPARGELAVLRGRAIAMWGEDSIPFLHLARACVALRLMQYSTTNRQRAKVVASLSAGRARELSPDWEKQPKAGVVEF